jgi:predicted alpha/beta superfamily hydrolase
MRETFRLSASFGPLRVIAPALFCYPIASFSTSRSVSQLSTIIHAGEAAAAGPGHLQKFENYRSRYLPGERTVIVYVPGIYDRRPDLRFPVLYMQDGQNLFDPETSFIRGMYWRIGETADRLIAEAAIEPLIIVGIYNTGKRRLREYTPSRDRRAGGGGADRYGRLLTREIKPFIESQFRALPGPANTGIGGSSLGGLVTIYLGLRFRKIFGKIAALSPSLWWNQRWIMNYVDRIRVEPKPRIYLDAGTQESAREIDDLRRLRDIFLGRGWREGHDLRYSEIQGGKHDEAAWADRVDPFLRFLFPAG